MQQGLRGRRLRPRGRRIGMRWWLAAAFALVGLITATAAFLFVTDQSGKVLNERAAEIAVGRTVRIARELGDTGRSGSREIVNRESRRFNGFTLWVTDTVGDPITRSRIEGIDFTSVENQEQAVKVALEGSAYENDISDEGPIVEAFPIRRDGRVDGALLTRLDGLREFEGVLPQLRRDALTALGIAVGVAIVIGVLVASLIARRVRRLALAAEEMEAGRLDTPLGETWHDEIGDLSHALDGMREALRDSFNVLSSERDKLSTIFAGLRDAVLVVGYDGELRFTNPAGERLLHRGSPVTELQPLLRRAADRGKAEQPDLEVGDRIYGVHVRDLPAEQAVLAAVGDRTAELRRERAEREFVSNAAHELRNPIAGISTTVEVLQDGAKDDPDAREMFLDRLTEDTDRLTRIITAMLTLARWENVDRGESGVVDIPVAAREALAHAETPPGLEVRLDLPDDLAANGDPVLLRQVLIGLVSNAFKHTDPPGVVTVRGRQEGTHHVMIEVQDTGTGIPPAEQPRVFERFFRGEDSRNREGFGLGLAIAKRMVSAMDGEIGVRSSAGEGSTFWVRLPLGHHSPTPVA
ncbi:MAG: ATP-binding protein [Solirubrobacterales bacterium]